MSDSFIIQFTTSDAAADLLNATGSLDFGGETPGDTDYSGGYYELTYTIGQGETDGGDDVAITVYDRVSNSITGTLSCTLDNTGPFSLKIDTVVETSDFLHYDSSREIFFYSNDQSMNDSFAIQVSASYSGAGLKNATGEDEFGETGVEDTTYTAYYELTYTISQSENASDNLVTITVFDQCANSNTVALNTTLDNVGPRDQTITQINDFGSKYIYLYNSTSLILFVLWRIAYYNNLSVCVAIYD
jgi:hypothetical protein